MPTWMEILKLLASGVVGFLSSSVIFIWKERKASRKSAEDNYTEALAIAARNREVAQAGAMMLYKIVQEIQASPMALQLVEIRKPFQQAAAEIAEPNAQAADEFYRELYKLDGHIPLKASKAYLKKAKHYLTTNEAANRSMEAKLSLVRISLQLGRPELAQ
ncbi:hypothetical protein [Pseudomonas turukhanskensis]|uniref:Uncharacterized protein n=1 Tax=Pseudomonas turukhanskensis TaxID=1806536 RepID=A0A9W6K3Y3_9PSED|nr:hypothetical protein [Pseudomonas turukhanskensis]GLK88337.1 hypothetical protein GCM10017655_13990 [Pseudomonas turukhanskensis]